jgi:HEAT repeat protein
MHEDLTPELAKAVAAVVARIVPAGRPHTEELVRRIVAAGGTSHDALLEMLTNPALELSLRSDIAWLLGRVRWPQAADALHAMTKATEASLREQAARALGMYDGDYVVDALLEAMRDREAAVRSAAIEALGVISSPRSATALLERLRDEREDASVRADAAEALAHVEHEAAVDGLLDALAAESPLIRYSAAYALGEQGDARAIDALHQLEATDATTTPWGDVAECARDAIETIRARDDGE